MHEKQRKKAKGSHIAETTNDKLQDMVRQYHAGMLAVETYRMRRAQLLDGLVRTRASLEGDTTLPHGISAIVPKRRHPRGLLLLVLVALLSLIAVGVVWWSLDMKIMPLGREREAMELQPAQSGKALAQEFFMRGTWDAGETKTS